ncbi:MAG: hypothetical protein JKY13_00205 [Gammaproteobacteria bacterium]|nr:hypothetical protein [Gammaproteobacteria bacterium]
MDTQHFKWNSQCHSIAVDGQIFGVITTADTSEYPSLGGCRILNKTLTRDDIQQCIDLAYVMQLKARLHNLPVSGGKALLCLPEPQKRESYLQHFAKKINQLLGQYVTAVDMGSDQQDMDLLSQYTHHVTCHTKAGGDPSWYTAQTTLLSIQATYQAMTGSQSLKNKRVVIQGVGKVGYYIAQLLAEQHAIITICDVNDMAVKHCTKHIDCSITKPESVYQTQCDIFISCAGSKLLDQTAIKQLNTKLFAATANDPFSGKNTPQQLIDRNITYLPDFLINVGGLMCCVYQQSQNFSLQEKIAHVYDTVLKLLNHANHDNAKFYALCLRGAN